MQKWCNCNWIWFSISCRNCNLIFAVIEFNYTQLHSITFNYNIVFLLTFFLQSCSEKASSDVLISTCPLWFTPLPLWSNYCTEPTLPAARSCLISLILITLCGFLPVATCWFIIQDKANLSYGPIKLKMTTNYLSWFGKVQSLVLVGHKIVVGSFSHFRTCYILTCGGEQFNNAKTLSHVEMQWPTLQ